jgi:hypothetical protein
VVNCLDGRARWEGVGWKGVNKCSPQGEEIKKKGQLVQEKGKKNYADEFQTMWRIAWGKGRRVTTSARQGDGMSRQKGAI